MLRKDTNTVVVNLPPGGYTTIRLVLMAMKARMKYARLGTIWYRVNITGNQPKGELSCIKIPLLV